MASRALAAAVPLACTFGVALCWAASLAGHSHEVAEEATALLSGGDSHAGAATVVPILLVSTTYFLTVALVYLELAVVGNGNPGLIAAQRLAAATAKAAAVTSILALSAAVFGELWTYEI